MSEWQWCKITLQRIVADLALYCDSGRIMSSDRLDSYQVQLELVYRELLCIEVMGNLSYPNSYFFHYHNTMQGQRQFSAAYFCTIAIHS